MEVFVLVKQMFLFLFMFLLSMRSTLLWVMERERMLTYLMMYMVQWVYHTLAHNAVLSHDMR